jgi:tetratricopeptide (TPR) repeat protein
MVDTPRIEELKRRVQVDPASIAFAALAEEYRRAGRFEDAIATCQSGLQRHPAYLSARVTLGRALLELGRFDEARQELEHVLRAAPENLAAIRGLAEIHHRRGELPEALEQYRSALQVAKHDTEIEQAVDQISRQVTPTPPAASEPNIAPEAPAAAAPPVLSPPPLRKPIQLVTRAGPPVEPEPQPVMPDPEPVMPDPVSLMSATEPPAPALAEGSETFHHEPEVMPDPTLVALEGFLAAIRREKDALTARTGLRR